MLWWVFVFLGMAIIASLRGLGGLASTAAGIAQVLFFVFLIVFLVALVMGSVRHRRSADLPNGDPEDGAEAPASASIRRQSLAGPKNRGRAKPRRAA